MKKPWEQSPNCFVCGRRTQPDRFLLFSAIRGQFALTTIADEVISRVPVLNDVESLVDLPLNLSRSKVIAEKDRLFSLSNFGKRFVRRVRQIVGVAQIDRNCSCAGVPPGCRAMEQDAVAA
jgi:hypothetical protein